MLRGIWAEEHDEGNMNGQGKYMLHCFVIVISYYFSPAQSKPTPSFQAVNNNEELCNIFPYKEQK